MCRRLLAFGAFALIVAAHAPFSAAITCYSGCHDDIEAYGQMGPTFTCTVFAPNNCRVLLRGHLSANTQTCGNPSATKSGNEYINCADKCDVLCANEVSMYANEKAFFGLISKCAVSTAIYETSCVGAGGH
jgi:hypothetical protein